MLGKLFYRIPVICGLVILLTIASAWGADRFSMEKDLLRAGELWEIEGLDIASHEGTFLKEKAMVVEGLVFADPNFNLIPSLAESWKMRGDLVWEFVLRKGVKFHDGSPLTAEAVVKCLERTMSIDASVKKLSKIKSLKAEGDLVVVIETETINPMLPAAMVYSDMAILSPFSPADAQGVVEHPIGTGPYKLVEWKQAENVVVLERFEDYWGKKAKIKNLIYRAVPDPSTRSLEIQKGSLDLVPDAPYGDLEILRKLGLKVELANTARLYVAAFGSIKGTWFEDIRVRQAVSLSINRQEIVDHVLFGMGKPAAAPFEENMSFANKSLKPLEFNLEKAKKLLAEAGWSDVDGDGIIEKDGKKFAFTFYTYPQRPGLKPMAQAMASQLAAAGMKVDVRIMDYSAITKTMKPCDMRLVAAATAMIPDPDYFLRNYFHSQGNSNSWGYKNDEVDSLFAQGSGAVDPDKRKEIYDRIQAQVYADAPLVPVSYYGVNIIMKPQIKNFIFNPVAHDFMLNTDMFIAE